MGAAERVRVEGALGGIAGTQYAHVHPAKLARGLARAVERRGGIIHERTAVIDVLPGGDGGRLRPALRTRRGELRAETVVVAGEAYLAQIQRYHRALLPTYSLIVLTEPLTDEQWAGIGWRNRECVASYRLSIDYLARTPDGRILFGGRGAPYRFGSRIEPGYDRDARTHAMLRAFVTAWFPSLAGIRFSHAWGGPLGFPRDWLPTFSFDPRSGIATARGYTGHGVATTNLAGRILADLITGATTELTARSPWSTTARPTGSPSRSAGWGSLRPGVAPSAGREVGADGPPADRSEPGRATRLALGLRGAASGPGQPPALNG